MSALASSEPDSGPGPVVVAALCWALGILVVFQPMFASGFSLIPGWPEHDPRLVNFMLEYRYQWLLGAPGIELASPPIFFPVTGVASYSEPVLALLPFYAPFRALGLDAYGSYQAWLLLIWSLNYVAGLLLLRRAFGIGLMAASVGAFVFAFGSSRVVNLTKPHLLPYFFLVLALLALFALFRAPQGKPAGSRWAWTGVFFAALVAQFYTAFYPLYFFALALVVALFWALLLRDTRQATVAGLRRAALPALVWGLAALVLAWPLAVGYFDAASAVGVRSFATDKLTQWFSWVLLGPGNWFYGWLDGLPRLRPWSRSLHQNGLGFLTMLLALLGLWRGRHQPAVRLLFLVSLSLFLLTLRISDDWSLWRWVRVVLPGGEAIRAVARIGALIVFPVAVGLGFFFDRRGGPVVSAVLVALALFCFAEQVHRPSGFDRDFVAWRIERIAEAVPRDCRSFFLATTGRGGDDAVHDDAMWVALETGIPAVNGRYGNVPPGWELRQGHFATPAQKRELQERLGRWRARSGLTAADVCWVEIDRGEQFRAWQKMRAAQTG